VKSAPTAEATALPSLPDGWQPVRYAILGNGQLAILGADADLRREWRPDKQGRQKGDPWKATARATARIWTFDGATLVAGPAFPLLLPFPLFDRFPDGRWLVTNSRADEAPLGRILTPEGKEISRIRLGDGIEHLKIDDHARIWVGWYDEGVFGNDAWRVPGHEWPPSSYGLAAFDDTGTIVAHANEGPANGIADCYALNVVADTAWACTYTDFPILACGSGTAPIWWSTELGGPRALAIGQKHVLAAGGYAKRANEVVLVRLEADRAQILARWRLPFGVDHSDSVDFIDGRGGELHAVKDGVWHRWRIADYIADLKASQRA
jgi:hypothetical protein